MKVWNIQISTLSKELQLAVEQFECFVPKAEGCPVIAEQNEKDPGFSHRDDTLVIRYSSKRQFVYLLFLALAGNKEEMSLTPAFKELTAMLDVSRNAVKTVASIKEFMKYMVLMGYHSLHLYMEDIYDVPEEPYFGYKRGKYSKEELREIVEFGNVIGLEVIPSIQTLAHLATALHWLTYAPIHDTQGILMADEDRTYELIEHMLKALRECFVTDKINLGMDEAHWVGLGQYLDKHGYTDRVSIMVRHLHHVYELANKYGFTRPMMWNDMFLRLVNQGEYDQAKDVPNEILDMIPGNITFVSWNYYKMEEDFYQNMLHVQKMFGREVYFAGGAGSWFGSTPQNAFAMEQTTVAMKVCKEMGIENYIMTAWGDDGADCSPFACLPAFAYAAGIANNVEHKSLFYAMTGIAFDDFMTLDLPNEVSKKSVVVVEPAKQALFNDPLYGILDCMVKTGDSFRFSEYLKQISPMTTDARWGYLFLTQEALLKILTLKYELGIQTRKAYHEGKESLQKLLPKYEEISGYIEQYYEALRNQWYAENKRYGFEVQDYRLGGLIRRMDNARRTLVEFIEGEELVFEELEEGVLSVMCDETLNGMGIDYREFSKIASANIL